MINCDFEMTTKITTIYVLDTVDLIKAPVVSKSHEGNVYPCTEKLKSI